MLPEMIFTYMINSFDTGYWKLHGNFVGKLTMSCHYSQTDKITEAICRQLMEFTTPVYLALFDESDRFNSDPELTKLLLNVSVALNSTLEMARYLVSHHKRLDFHLIYFLARLLNFRHLWDNS